MTSSLKRALIRLAYAGNRVVPSAKDFLPKSLHRRLLLRILDVNRKYNSFRDLPSRRFFESDVLPWTRDNYARILFVGTASYTYHYEALFRRNPAQFTTLDYNPGGAVWGAWQHIVAPIQEIDRHRPKGFFDCAILNGVFGFGVDETDDMRSTVEAVHNILRPDGLLILGWNTDRHPDPSTLGLFEPFFLPWQASPWGSRVRFASESHVYDFFIRRSGSSSMTSD